MADAPVSDHGLLDKIQAIFERPGLKEAIGQDANDPLVKALAERRELLNQGVDPAKHFYQEHFGKHMDKLADPKTGPLECAVELKALAVEVGKISTPFGIAKTAGEEVLKSEIASLEKRYDGLEKVVHTIETAKDGKEKAEHLKKDLTTVKSELGVMKKAIAEHNVPYATIMAERLVADVHKLDKDIAAAREFVDARAPKLPDYKGVVIDPKPGSGIGPNVTPDSGAFGGDVGRWGTPINIGDKFQVSNGKAGAQFQVERPNSVELKVDRVNDGHSR